MIFTKLCSIFGAEFLNIAREINNTGSFMGQISLLSLNQQHQKHPTINIKALELQAECLLLKLCSTENLPIMDSW